MFSQNEVGSVLGTIEKMRMTGVDLLSILLFEFVCVIFLVKKGNENNSELCVASLPFLYRFFIKSTSD